MKRAIQKELAALGQLVGCWDEVWDDARDVPPIIVNAVRDKAARLGLFSLVEIAPVDATVETAQVWLSRCIAALPASDVPDVPLLTAEETIEYLRLGVDARDPAERLRNLIRRQKLPVIHRGRLMLFRRSALDEWLDRKRTTTIEGSRGRPRHKVNPQREKA
jgi:hypothetical protein